MSVHSTFSLFKRSNGIYYVKYFKDNRVRWKSTCCSRKADALQALNAFDQLFAAKPTTTSLSSFVSEYLGYSRVNHTSGTFEVCRYTLQRFQAYMEECKLSSISLRHVDGYKTKRLAEVSPVTVNIELRTLRAAFGVAVRWKMIETNPFSAIRLAKVDERAPTFFTKPEFEKLLSIIRENWLLELVIFSVTTGLRRGEVLNLRWQDVDLVRKVVHIQGNSTFRTKHGKRRTIPLNDTAYALLVKRQVGTACEWVFSRQGGKIGKSYLTHRFKRYLRIAGLSEDLCWHSLRHTFASWLAQDGVSLYAIQKLLGHSSSSVTQIYSHLQPEQLHDTVNRISLN